MLRCESISMCISMFVCIMIMPMCVVQYVSLSVFLLFASMCISVPVHISMYICIMFMYMFIMCILFVYAYYEYCVCVALCLIMCIMCLVYVYVYYVYFLYFLSVCWCFIRQVCGKNMKTRRWFDASLFDSLPI